MPLRPFLIWLALVVAIVGPLAIAASSPLLAWRQPVYIIAGFAGVCGLAMLLLQPLFASGRLPGLTLPVSRRIHRFLGAALVAMVIVHVAGLWVTSPPDVIDALTFASPTPFSAWGVIAMWTIFLTGLIAALRRRLRLSLRQWQLIHMALAVVIVVSTIVHALLIDGTMGTLSKAMVCALVAGSALWVMIDMKRRRSGKRRSR